MAMNVFSRAVFCVLVLAATAFGQAVTGTLVGTISDSSGAAVSSARIDIIEVNTGVSRAVLSNQSGYYVFANLNAGRYRVSLEHPGFRKVFRENIDVFVNSTIRVDLELQPGAIAESINVTGEAPVLQTDRSDTGRRIETQQIVNLPLGFNRNFQSLLNLVPGATRAFRPHSEFFNPQDSLSTRVNGQSRMANSVQLEGVDNNMRLGLKTNLIPPTEALATIDITTSNYEAELGRAGGAVTNVTLRSGTNEWHGSVFEFNRVSLLAARNVFAQTKAPTTYNLYGFTLGGPIQKNRLFIFGDYQGIKDRRGDVNRATIPTMPFRTGDLSAAPTIIYDPATGNPNGTGRQPFERNIIPPNRISPISQRILSSIPSPTFAGFQTNFERATVRKKDSDSFDVKLDYHMSESHRFSGRYSFQRPVVDDPPLYGLTGGPGKDGYGGRGVQKTHSANINYTHVFSPTMITEVRVGLQRHRNDAENADIGIDASEDLGISGVNVSRFTSGLTTINIEGYTSPVAGYNANLPWQKAETIFTYVNNWTKTLSNHTIKWGADVRRLRDDNLQFNTFGPRGRFNFTAGTTALNGDTRTGFANAFASFLLDLSNNYGRDLPVIFPSLRQTPVFTYVQDKWQVTPKLTVDIGLRHELWLPPTTPHKGGFSNYDPETNVLIVSGYGSNSNDAGRKTHWTGFAPRLGAAYRINDKTVFRGGFGMSVIPLADGGNNYAFNFPVRQSNSFNAPNSYSAAGSMAAGFPAPQLAVIPEDGIIRNAPEQFYNVIRPNVKEGYIQTWNVALQRALPASFTLETAYVGNHGVRIGAVRNINAGTTPGAGAAGQPLFQKFGIRSAINELYYPTTSDYHAMQVKFDRRFSGGFLLTTSYTFGKAIDYSNDNGGLAVPSSPEANRARANFDSTHIFTQSYVYELPFGRRGRWLKSGVGKVVLGDWQLNGILTTQTGTPLNITVSDATLDAPGNTNRPDLLGKPEIYGGVGREAFWFDTSKFAAPRPVTYGTAGRNILTGPGLVNLDFSLFRKFPITESVEGELRFESLNFTNTPHFNNPGGGFGNPGFGQVTTAMDDQRAIQLGLKISF